MADSEYDPAPLLDLSLLDYLEAGIGRSRLLYVLQIYIDESAILMSKLCDLGPAPDRQAMYLVVHQLAGSSGTLAMKQLSDLAIAIEMRLNEAEPDDFAASRDQLCALREKTIRVLVGHFPELRLKPDETSLDEPENQP